MPSTRLIRRRISSVKNITQLTKAMELVAASRMRRAQQNVLSSRPFSQKVLEIIGDIAGLQEDIDYRNLSPLLQQREVKQVGMVLVTTDKGLAGSLNTNSIRRAVRFINEETGGKPVKLVTVGRKGRDFMVRVGREVIAEFTNLPAAPSLLDTLPISRVVIDDYTNGKLDAVYLLYSNFINTLTQRPTIVKLLPIDPTVVQNQENAENRPNNGGKVDFIFEPDAATVLQGLLPRYVEVEIFQAILENIASEQSSKMVAMRAASDKGKELVGDLTLSYNKLRQSNITTEILEIASAANAMRDAG